jgi:hypothetical protein
MTCCPLSVAALLVLSQAAFLTSSAPAAAEVPDGGVNSPQIQTDGGCAAHGQQALYLSIRHDEHILEYKDTVWNLPAASVVTPVMNAIVSDAGWWDQHAWQWHGGLVFNSSVALRLRNIQGLQNWYWDRDWNHDAYVAHRAGLQLTASQDQGSGGTTVCSLVYLSLLHLWNNVFQHIAIDTIPKLSFTCPFLREHAHVKVLVHNRLQQELVQEFCPLPEWRFVIFSTAAQAAQILVPRFEGLEQVPLYNGLVPPRSIASHGGALQGDTVVYLARKKGARRSVTNEADLLRLLRARFAKVQVVYPSNDWRVDKHALSSACALVGPHGGAFANMIFAPKNTTIVEFLPLRALEKLNAGLEAQVERTLALRENARPAFMGLAKGLGFRCAHSWAHGRHSSVA